LEITDSDLGTRSDLNLEVIFSHLFGMLADGLRIMAE
jgi:hypothetical protein